MKVQKFILRLLGGLIILSAAASCAKEKTEVETPATDHKGIGEMVNFSAGATEASSATKADASTYYMPDSYRFVCRMYYKAATGSSKFDVSGDTDETTWLKVSGNVGNSLYWRKNYGTPSSYDSYGNDADAACLYWQNRKEHAFLAWLDLNKATTNVYSPATEKGYLKFTPEDVTYTKHTGDKQVQDVLSGYHLYCGDSTEEFTSWSDLRTFMETAGNYETYVKDKIPDGLTKEDFQNQEYFYAYGWSCKYCTAFATSTSIDQTHSTYGWVQYNMYYDKLKYEGATSGTNIIEEVDDNNVPIFLYDTVKNQRIAAIEIDAENVKHYYITDEYGNVKYDENNPRYTFYYKELYEKKEAEVVKELAANCFDLTSGTKASISEQPDICQALTIQAPLSATQSGNRVNLYFKHQFSQVQVNIKSSADLSVVINKDHIQKVELLGVSEKGYVFTELDEDGNVEPSTYETVDVSNYTEEQLAKNQYGTSFSMFDMGSDNYPSGYIKSFNAITFGQLQAIRITWNEAADGSGISHESTYHVANETLKNLKSGNKYVWNIELRRGTLAIVRTEIVDWIVPENELEYGTSGTITN